MEGGGRGFSLSLSFSVSVCVSLSRASVCVFLEVHDVVLFLLLFLLFLQLFGSSVFALVLFLGWKLGSRVFRSDV